MGLGVCCGVGVVKWCWGCGVVGCMVMVVEMMFWPWVLWVLLMAAWYILVRG